MHQDMEWSSMFEKSESNWLWVLGCWDLDEGDDQEWETWNWVNGKTSCCVQGKKETCPFLFMETFSEEVEKWHGQSRHRLEVASQHRFIAPRLPMLSGIPSGCLGTDRQTVTYVVKICNRWGALNQRIQKGRFTCNTKLKRYVLRRPQHLTKTKTTCVS